MSGITTPHQSAVALNLSGIKDLHIVRESCTKSAAAFCARRSELKSADLFCLAERMEAWVLR